MKNSAAPSAAPGPIQIRAPTRATPAAKASMIGSSKRLNCGTPKSNSAWKVDRPISRPPNANIRRPRASAVRQLRRPGAGSRPSTIRMQLPIRVRPAPPISIRWVGPQRVTSWPKMRCQTSSSGKPISAKAADAIIAIPPSGAYQSPLIRTAARLGRPSGSTIARKPAVKIP